MPFYQILCIASHQPHYKYIKNLVRTSALHVMEAGGVVRNFQYLGPRVLSEKPKRAKGQNVGDYWTLNFDCSPKVLKELQTKLNQDPMVIRATTLKLGTQLMEIIEPQGVTKVVKSKPVTSPYFSHSGPLTATADVSSKPPRMAAAIPLDQNKSLFSAGGGSASPSKFLKSLR